MAANQLSHFKRLFIVSGTFVALAVGLVVGYSNCAPAMNTMDQPSIFDIGSIVWRPNTLATFSCNQNSPALVAGLPTATVWCDPSQGANCGNWYSPRMPFSPTDNYPAGLTFSSDVIKKLRSGQMSPNDLPAMPNWNPQLYIVSDPNFNPASISGIWGDSSKDSSINTSVLRSGATTSFGNIASCGSDNPNYCLWVAHQGASTQTLNLALSFYDRTRGSQNMATVPLASGGSRAAGELLRLSFSGRALDFGNTDNFGVSGTSNSYGILPFSMGSWDKNQESDPTAGGAGHLWSCSAFFITKLDDARCDSSRLDRSSPNFAPPSQLDQAIIDKFNASPLAAIGRIGVVNTSPFSYSFACFSPKTMGTNLPACYGGTAYDPITSANNGISGGTSSGTWFTVNNRTPQPPWYYTGINDPHWMTFCYRK